MMKKGEAKAILYEWQQSMVKHGVPLDTSKVQALRVAIEAIEAQGQAYVCPRCGKVFGEPLQTACRCDKCKHGHLDPHDHADEYRCDKSEYVGRKWHDWWFGCFEGERRDNDA